MNNEIEKKIEEMKKAEVLIIGDKKFINMDMALEFTEKMVEGENNRTIDEVIAVIEGYFKGLIAIPDPQATAKSLTGYIYALKKNGITIEQYLLERKK